MATAPPSVPALTHVLTCNSTRTTMIHVVQPQDCLFVNQSLQQKSHLREGFLLKLMDLCTCASAETLSAHQSVTLAVDDLVFINTHLSVGETIIVKSQVNCAWGTSMECGCTVVAEDDNGTMRRVCKAFFTFVSLDQEGVKIRLPKLQAEDSDNLRRLSLAAERRKIRFRRAAIIARAAAKFSLKLRSVSTPASGGGGGGGGPPSSTTKPSSTPVRGKDVVISTSSVEEKHINAPPLVMTEIVLPQHANHHGNTFGGQIMAWMSIAARVVASRHASASAAASAAASDSTSQSKQNQFVVLAQSIDDIFFVSPSRVGDRVVVEARVTRTFARTLEVSCEVHAHEVGGEGKGGISFNFETFQQGFLSFSIINECILFITFISDTKKPTPWQDCL